MSRISSVDELVLNFIELKALASISRFNTLCDHLRLPELVFKSHLFKLKLADMPLKIIFVSLETFFIDFKLTYL